MIPETSPIGPAELTRKGDPQSPFVMPMVSKREAIQRQ